MALGVYVQLTMTENDADPLTTYDANMLSFYLEDA
jgi:hypothetical protein